MITFDRDSGEEMMEIVNDIVNGKITIDDVQGSEEDKESIMDEVKELEVESDIEFRRRML